MKKSLIIRRLEATVRRLRKLPRNQFNYREFVTEFDFGSTCGTVCCAAGWYPKWFPKSGVCWSPIEADLMKGNTMYRLSDYHGLNEAIIQMLFAGDELAGTNFKNISNMVRYTPQQLANRFERFIEVLRKGKHDNILISK